MKRVGRSIRTRLAVSVFLAVALFLTVDHGLRRASFRGTFEEMENTRAGEVLNGVDRAIHALAGELSHYSTSVVRTGGPRAIDCEQLGIEAAYIIGKDGSVLRSAKRATADDDEQAANALAKTFPNGRWSKRHPVLRAWSGGVIPGGILPVIGSGRLLLLGCSEVTIDGKDALSVSIRAVDGLVLSEIAKIADVRPQFFLLSNPATDPDDLSRLDQATATGKPVIASRSSFSVTVYSPLQDLAGMPVGGIKADIPLRNAELWARMERFELQTALGVALVFPLLLLILVQLVVTGPLGRLTSHIVQIGQSDDATSRLGSERSDEIGALAQEFDRMLSKLERSRVLQKRSARMTGRSEIAADVVHSTGNILNSIAVSSSLARQKAAGLDVDDLRHLHGEFVRHGADLAEYLREDPRGQHAVAFLGAAVDHLDQGLRSLESDAKDVEGLVEKAVEMLQSLTQDRQAGSVDEVTNLEQLLVEAARTAGAESEEISVEYHVSQSPEVRLDRQRLLEVLVSVIQNSVRAMSELPPVERVLVLSLDEADGGYRIQVTDTGVGIAPELLPRVFEMGTSCDGHTAGMGLHQASLAMNALGGDIHIESEGVGLGAKAIVHVPDSLAGNGGHGGASQAPGSGESPEDAPMRAA